MTVWASVKYSENVILDVIEASTSKVTLLVKVIKGDKSKCLIWPITITQSWTVKSKIFKSENKHHIDKLYESQNNKNSNCFVINQDFSKVKPSLDLLKNFSAKVN